MAGRDAAGVTSPPPGSYGFYPNNAAQAGPGSQGMVTSPSMDGSISSQTNSNGQVHRRTQSLRPFSAFQPLENPASYNGDGPGPRPPSPRSARTLSAYDSGLQPWAAPTGSTARSIRSTPAPLTFKSPDLRKALGLQEAHGKKIYMEGYLSRREESGVDGKPIHAADPKRQWQLCFVQLSGTVLSIWNVKNMEEAAKRGQEVPPSYTNITDSVSVFPSSPADRPTDRIYIAPVC